MALSLMQRGAEFSEDRVYRYTLWRTWDDAKPTLLVIGLNPSTADEQTDDPTIRRCIAFAQKWGYGRLLMMNLFAFRATDPSVMRRAADPVGAKNDRLICLEAGRAGRVLAAWGVHGTYLDRAGVVTDLLTEGGTRLYCLGKSKDGHPRHPLYVPSATDPEPYTGFTA